MARQETIISVFVASPSNVEDERVRLEEVILELNTTWSRKLGIRLELIRWETHVSPGFGRYPQAVINEQIPQDFDIFIGLMWYKFGTPTERAGSGTAEEFQRAKERFDADPDTLQLMMYFKDAPVPIPLSQLDYTQLEKVSKFRSSLGEAGGLYWPFQTIDEFEKFVRIHLSRYIQTWQSQKENWRPSAELVEENTTSENFPYAEEVDEIGILDLTETVDDELSTLTEITERIGRAIAEIGEKMQVRTNEINEFIGSSDSKNPKAAKRLIVKAATDIDQCVYRMESELPLFSQHLNSSMNALTRIAELSIEFYTDDTHFEQVHENVRYVQKLREAMSAVENALGGFKETVSSIPRMTTVLNRSKRKMAKVIQRLMDELHSAQMMAREAERSFVSILKKDSEGYR